MHLDPSSLSILRTIFGMGLLAFVMGLDVRGAQFRDAPSGCVYRKPYPG
jgi:hypothetical protein